MTRNRSSRSLLAVLPTLAVVAVAVGAATTSPVTVASAGADPDVPGCLTDDLTGTLLGQAGGPVSGVRDALLQVTNTSGRACLVQGWADVALVTPPGELVDVPTSRVAQTGGGTVIVLEPQDSAWSRLRWDVCPPARTGCGVGVTVQFIVDAESTGTAADLSGVPEADRAGITMEALRVGPLQPTRAAALA